MADLPETLLSLIDYDGWAMHRVLEAAATLTAEQLAAPAGAPDRSIHRLLVHLNTTFRFWASSLQGRGEPDWSTLRVSSVGEIRTWSDGVRAEFREWVARLGVADLDRTVSRGDMTVTWAQAITQCLEHAIHHRGEIASLLTDVGHSPGDLDYLGFLRS